MNEEHQKYTTAFHTLKSRDRGLYREFKTRNTNVTIGMLGPVQQRSRCQRGLAKVTMSKTIKIKYKILRSSIFTWVKQRISYCIFE